METFDPKPEALAEYRGEFGAIATRLPGVQFCEVLPRMAPLADKVSIVRSIHQPSSNHVSATHTFITGKDRTGLVLGPPEHPDMSAVFHHMRSGQAGRVPKYVALGKSLHRGGTVYLGQAYGPFDVPGDPNGPDFRVRNLRLGESVPLGRLAQRMDMLGRLDRLRRELDLSGQMASLDRFQQQAVNMLTSPAAARAFDLARAIWHAHGGTAGPVSPAVGRGLRECRGGAILARRPRRRRRRSEHDRLG